MVYDLTDTLHAKSRNRTLPQAVLDFVIKRYEEFKNDAFKRIDAEMKSLQEAWEQCDPAFSDISDSEPLEEQPQQVQHLAILKRKKKSKKKAAKPDVPGLPGA